MLSGRSIAVRLALSSLFWSSFVLLVSGLVLTTLYRRNTEQGFDERLLVYANDLAAELVQPADDPRNATSLGDPRFEIPLSGWYWQVGPVNALPHDLRSSRSLVGNPLPNLAKADPNRPFGQTRTETVSGPENRSLRMVERDIDLGEDGRFVVRVTGPADEIVESVNRFVVALLFTFLMLGAGLGLTTLLQIRFGLRPLSDLRRAVAAVRRGQAVHVPGRYPGDVAPLADELNLLLDSNRQILERARTQVGNLAHALKTPLSVIVNEAGHPTGELPQRVAEQAAIMQRQVEYYLNRARAAALARSLGAATDVEPVLAGLCRTFAKIAREKTVELRRDEVADLRFRGERQDLEEMVGNLIDNACKWAAGRVEIGGELVDSDGRSALHVIVDDDGPGIPDGVRHEAVQRGRRLDESKPGSGLGLAIVAEIAELYGGHLVFGGSPLGGARVELVLPGGDTAAAALL